jgi:hypothetical protein
MSTSTREYPSAWAVGGSFFAAVLMVTVGVFQFIEGLVSLIDGRKFYLTTPSYTFEFSSTTWGWVHLVLGAGVAIAGFFIFTGNVVARGVGVFVAAVSAVANFLWLPHYPLWAILIIAIDVLVMWSLASASLADPT